MDSSILGDDFHVPHVLFVAQKVLFGADPGEDVTAEFVFRVSLIGGVQVFLLQDVQQSVTIRIFGRLGGVRLHEPIGRLVRQRRFCPPSVNIAPFVVVQVIGFERNEQWLVLVRPGRQTDPESAFGERSSHFPVGPVAQLVVLIPPGENAATLAVPCHVIGCRVQILAAVDVLQTDKQTLAGH